jgi:tetratricopeptide (TPR) repeat protein
MRLALVLSSKPSSPAEGAALRDGAAWLRSSLAPLGMRVVDASDAGAVDAVLAEARAGSDPDDALLVHVSGRFADGGFLWDGARHVPLRDLSGAVARRGLDRVLFVLELTHDGREDDALRAAESVEAIDAALDLRARGFAALIAVRPTASRANTLAFTRLVMASVEGARGADPSRTLLLSELHEHVRAAAHGNPAAQSFALVRGSFDFEISVPIAASRVPARASIADDAADAPLLEPLLALADGGRARKEWEPALAGYRAALLLAPDDALTRGGIYSRIGMLERERGRLRDSIRAFEEAVSAVPSDRASFDSLVSLSVGAGDLAREVEFRHRRAALIADPEQKVDELFAIARLLVEKLHDLPGAIDLLEEAQSIDPRREDVLEALRRALTVLARRAGDGGEGGEEGGGTDDPTTDERQVSGEIDTRAAQDASTTVEADLDALERTAALAPLEPSTYERLLALHVRAGRPDRACLAAMALEELGAAGAEANALLSERRADGPIKPRAPFDDAAWSAIRAPGSDEVVEQLFSVVARAAVAAHVDQRRERRKLATLDPARRQSATSTASAVRSFHWAAHILGVSCPALYVLDEVQGGIAAVPAEEASTALGPTIVRGLSTKDLAFLAGRHLAYYRPEHNVLVYFPTLKQLTILLLATVQLSLSGLPVPDSIAAQVGALRERVERRLRGEEHPRIAAAVGHLDARGGRADLAAWIRSVELTAARAGLLLCGDLRTAMTRARADARGIAGVTIDDTRADLVAFCASRTHGDLRERFAFGVEAAPSSMSGVLTRGGRITSAIASG